MNGLFFWVALVIGSERIKSLHAIWGRAFSQFDRISSIAFFFVRALAVVQSKTQLSPIRGESENSFFLGVPKPAKSCRRDGGAKGK